MSSLIVSFIESSNHCILASSLLVLVWFFSLWVLELMVILMTSSSSSKTEFTRIFYDVFDVGGYAGSSQLEVSLLYLLAYLPCLFSLYYWFLFGSSLCEFWSLWSSWWQARVHRKRSSLASSMMYSMLEVMPVLLGWRFHSSICWHTSPASSYYNHSLSCIQQAWVCSIRSSFAEVMAVLVLLDPSVVFSCVLKASKC